MVANIIPFVLAAARAPEIGGYVNPLKIAPVALLVFLWAMVTQWVDRDTELVKTKREQWNTIVAIGGLVAFFVLAMVPWKGPLYFAGLAAWFVIWGGSVIAYVVHRNGRVVPAAKLLTPAHVRRLMAGTGKPKRRGKDKDKRILLYDHKGESVELPDDEDDFDDHQVVQNFLFDALWRRASDTDLLAGRDKCRLVHRIDGVASEQADGIPLEDGQRIFRYLKRVAGLNAEEIRRPQRGSIQVGLLDHVEDLGPTIVQTSGTTAGERLRLRFHSTAKLRRTDDLGFAQARNDRLKELMTKNTGLVLVGGLPSNGVTTTLYAILRGHDAFMNNIHTLERNTMRELDNITQQVFSGSNTDVDYARMLQTVIRREPDIVMVGECEDRETAQIATRAAGDDRKLYVALAAKDCFDALSRYLEFVDDNAAASKALLGIINQRLVRILCKECREAFRPDPATLRKLNLPVDKIERFYRPPTQPLLDKKGNEITCASCQGTGYVGRTGVFEVLVVDSEVADLIAQGAAIKKIKSQCRKSKMYYLQEEGLLKVIEGTTSLNEVLRVLRDNAK